MMFVFHFLPAFADFRGNIEAFKIGSTFGCVNTLGVKEKGHLAPHPPVGVDFKKNIRRCTQI